MGNEETAMQRIHRLELENEVAQAAFGNLEKINERLTKAEVENERLGIENEFLKKILQEESKAGNIPEMAELFHQAYTRSFVSLCSPFETNPVDLEFANLTDKVKDCYRWAMTVCIRNLQKQGKLVKQVGWIRLTEGLPEKDRKVLAKTHDGYLIAGKSYINQKGAIGIYSEVFRASKKITDFTEWRYLDE